MPLSRAGLLCLECLGVLTALLTAAACFALWRVSAGDFDANVLVPFAEAALERNFGPGSDVSINDLSLERTAGEGFRVTLSDVYAEFGVSEDRVEVPKIELGLHFDDFFAGRLGVRTIFVDSPALKSRARRR